MARSKDFTFRQRWFPTFEDAETIAGEKDKDPANLGGLSEWIKRWVRTVALGVIAGVGGCQAIGNHVDYSEGDRVGVVNKLSEKGLIWKTTEGQLSLEGRTSTGEQTGAGTWNFSLDRTAEHGEDTQALRAKIAQCMDGGKRTKIHYIEKLATSPHKAATDNLVQKVECETD